MHATLKVWNIIAWYSAYVDYTTSKFMLDDFPNYPVINKFVNVFLHHFTTVIPIGKIWSMVPCQQSGIWSQETAA
jgi:hypothetical protein